MGRNNDIRKEEKLWNKRYKKASRLEKLRMRYEKLTTKFKASVIGFILTSALAILGYYLTYEGTKDKITGGDKPQINSNTSALTSLRRSLDSTNNKLEGYDQIIQQLRLDIQFLKDQAYTGPRDPKSQNVLFNYKEDPSLKYLNGIYMFPQIMGMTFIDHDFFSKAINKVNISQRELEKDVLVVAYGLNIDAAYPMLQSSSNDQVKRWFDANMVLNSGFLQIRNVQKSGNTNKIGGVRVNVPFLLIKDSDSGTNSTERKLKIVFLVEDELLTQYLTYTEGEGTAIIMQYSSNSIEGVKLDTEEDKIKGSILYKILSYNPL